MKKKIWKKRIDGHKQRYTVRAWPGRLYHGTSEESLAQIGLSGGLKPRGGVVFLTDDPKYARLKGREAVRGTKFEPAIIEVQPPRDLRRIGRHFITRESIPTRSFTKVHMRGV